MNKNRLSRRNTIYFPQSTIREDTFGAFGDEMLPLGNTAAVIYGERAWAASKGVVVPALKQAGIRMAYEALHGQDATFENVGHMTKNLQAREADYLLAVGGGKCIDTVKLAADRLGKPMFTIPSIASNCAPVTGIGIMYHEDGSSREISRLKTVPAHCFINPRVVLVTPVRYLWAGVGNAMAKNVESEWFAEVGEQLNYDSGLGIVAGRLCFTPIIRSTGQTLRDATEERNSDSLEQMVLNVVASPGITSMTVAPEYNDRVAHALFYSLTGHHHIERHHLHGEVVSYGTLVNLMLGVIHGDSRERLKAACESNRSLDLPVCLANLELGASDTLEDVLEVTMKNQELLHTPYPISKEAIHQAILNLEDYSPGA